mmetsp:Transcript_26954/g.80812  ORF Transcript_26954/g.80812 Transcript_26954/m.80812 type:complete len:207 (+) Transcript_26954:663-1283(+)
MTDAPDHSVHDHSKLVFAQFTERDETIPSDTQQQLVETNSMFGKRVEVISDHRQSRLENCRKNRKDFRRDFSTQSADDLFHRDENFRIAGLGNWRLFIIAENGLEQRWQKIFQHHLVVARLGDPRPHQTKNITLDNAHSLEEWLRRNSYSPVGDSLSKVLAHCLVHQQHIHVDFFAAGVRNRDQSTRMREYCSSAHYRVSRARLAA